MQRYATAFALMIALSGCGSNESANERSSGATAADVAGASISGGAGVSVADLPSFVELPAGATAINNMRVREDGKTGGTLTLKVKQKPADVIAFYRASMAKHGLKIGLENVSDQMVQFIGESDDKAKSLMVMVLADDTGEVTLNLVHSSAEQKPEKGAEG